MKKRLIFIVLCLCLLLAALPITAAAEPALSLISVDDLLPGELINTMAYYGSTIYVPYWLFTNYGLGISYSYSAANSTACVSNSSGRQLFFDLANGKTYDDDQYQYSVPAIVRGGTIYLPLSFMCGFFGGFSYGNIGGNEYGSILRIRTGRETLTDEEFLRLAKPAMQRYYASYYEKQNTETTPAPSPSPTVPAGATQAHEGDRVLLGLEGLPAAETAEMLTRLGMQVCFFLTAEEIRSAPDLVRRLSCEGFSLGVVCPEGTDAELSEASGLLWETARVMTAAALVPADCENTMEGVRTFTRMAELAENESDKMASAYAVTSLLERSDGDTTIIFPCSGENETTLRVLAYFLRDQGFSVRGLRATDGIE